ncbi:hypothetical protein B0H19DRAFT_1064301 [Mycena capillaripes]|nr:hypothetical protein B0H19DRAFT_1064301 [Mycena capillaripes]
MPTPGATRSVCVLAPPGAQMVFLVSRRRAMVSRCVPAIHMMFTILKFGYMQGICALPLEQIWRQLEVEYCVEVSEDGVVGAGSFAPPAPRIWRRKETICWAIADPASLVRLRG